MSLTLLNEQLPLLFQLRSTLVLQLLSGVAVLFRTPIQFLLIPDQLSRTLTRLRLHLLAARGLLCPQPLGCLGLFQEPFGFLDFRPELILESSPVVVLLLKHPSELSMMLLIPLLQKQEGLFVHRHIRRKRL